MKIPSIDLGACSGCEGCIALCPEVFRRNEGTGCLEVVELSAYPEAEVDEAIRDCPENCISWEEM